MTTLGLSRVIVLALVVVGLGACQPAKLPKDMPGPPGCGMRDPRNTSPNMLSMAQKMAYRESRAIREVRPNGGGLIVRTAGEGRSKKEFREDVSSTLLRRS